MYEAIKELYRKQYTAPIVTDKDGHIIGNDAKKLALTSKYYSDKYKGDALAFDTESGTLENEIISAEVTGAANKLNNQRASGPDGIAAEQFSWFQTIL